MLNPGAACLSPVPLLEENNDAHPIDTPIKIPRRKRAPFKRFQAHAVADRSIPEKFLTRHLGLLDDHDLLELTLILSDHCLAEDAPAMADALIKKFVSFSNFLSASSYDLKAAAGLSKKGVALVLLIRAAVAKLIRTELDTRPVITNMTAFVEYIKASYFRGKFESFCTMFLNKKLTITDESVYDGTVSGVVVYPREILARVLYDGASAIITVHIFHGNGNDVSSSILEAVSTLLNGCRLLGITYYDHIIFCDDGIMSLRAARMMNNSEEPYFFKNNLADCIDDHLHSNFR